MTSTLYRRRLEPLVPRDPRTSKRNLSPARSTGHSTTTTSVTRTTVSTRPLTDHTVHRSVLKVPSTTVSSSTTTLSTPSLRNSSVNCKTSGSKLPSSRYWRSQFHACTVDDLLHLITAPSGGYYVLPTDPYNEVFPNIYIGDGPTALCTSLLKRLGITHVVNAAQGKEKELCLVNTWAGFYRHADIKFLGIEALDHISFKLDNYFEEAADFIHSALESGGKVLVHCRAGISRSATLVIAYLMIKRGMTVQEALKTVRAKRAIIPNDGFLRQLCELDDRLNLEKACNALTLM